MGNAFQRPVGAHADTMELEYISALHQSDTVEGLRRNASISAEDVRLFLKSRYGIQVSREEVRKVIFPGLAGGDDDDECVDLVEVVAILVIPSLLRAGCDRETEDVNRSNFLTKREYDAFVRDQELSKSLQPDARVIDAVLNSILTETLGPREVLDGFPQLTRELVRSMFATYGETDMVKDDDVIDAMILQATNGRSDAVLDGEAFSQALTADVQLYDIGRETQISTHYYDVFQTEQSTKKRQGLIDTMHLLPKSSHHNKNNGDDTDDQGSQEEKAESDFDNEQHADEMDSWDEQEPIEKTTCSNIEEGVPVNGGSASFQQEGAPREVERIFTAPAIDFIAETYRSKVHVIFAWIAVIFTYLAYVYNKRGKSLSCSDDGYGCKIGYAILNWIFIMVELSCLGSAFVGLCSLGNSIFTASIFEVLSGMGFTFLFTVLPFIIETDLYIFDTNKDDDAMFSLSSLSIASLVTGCVLLLLHFKNLLRFLICPDQLSSWGLKAFFASGEEKFEFYTKQACCLKVNKMIQNAMELHEDLLIKRQSIEVLLNRKKTSHERAMLNFDKQSNKTEPCGSFLWAWKHFFSGNLARHEGLTVHGRLLAGNLAQFLMCILMLYVGIEWSNRLLDYVYSPPLTEAAFESLDEDGSNSISKAEAMAWPTATLLDENAMDSITELFDVTNGTTIVPISAVSAFFSSGRAALLDAGSSKSIGIQPKPPAFSFYSFREKTSKQLTLDQAIVLDRDSDGLISQEDIVKLFKSTAWIAKPHYEDETLSKTFENEEYGSFWNVMSAFDLGVVTGLPDPDDLHSAFQDIKLTLDFLEILFQNQTQAMKDERFAAYNVTEDQAQLFQILFGPCFEEGRYTFNNCLFPFMFWGLPDLGKTKKETFDKIFKLLDRDSDGILEESEVNEIVLDIFNRGKQAMDRHKPSPNVLDDILAFTEQSSLSLLHDQVVEEMFNRFDDDCNGELSREELFISWLSMLQKVTFGGKCYYKDASDGSRDSFHANSANDFSTTRDGDVHDVDDVNRTDSNNAILEFSSFFIDTTLEDYTPEKWMLRLSLAMGVTSALATGLLFAISYIPSTISTTMQYRCGHIPTLRATDFNSYRTGLTSTTMLIGAVFWGMLFTSIAVFVVISGITFILCWQGTRKFIVSLSAQIIGICVTIILKIILVKIIGKSTFEAFYRSRPAAANIFGLALECWHLGITVAFMLARAVKFVIASALFLGRIDKEFLSPGVGKIGPVTLDAYPAIFKQDILSAEAHRHPYLERLGLMYMLKLRYGKWFGKKAGSCWRLLFVFSLMPWLRKYRILSSTSIKDEETKETKGTFSTFDKVAELEKKIATLMKEHDQKMTSLLKENFHLRQKSQKGIMEPTNGGIEVLDES